ncbi:MAG: type II secretion system protein [Candidatus Taylorbacteria bacterium]
MKKFTSYARGFTLIELLVVIAIIGILASVVLVSLGSARAKGSDAKIQEQMSAIRNAAELFATSNSGSYGTTGLGGTMKNSSEFTSLMVGTNWPDSIAPTVVVGSNGGTWVAYHTMVSQTASSICADSTGVLKSIATLIVSSNSKLCNGTTDL